MGFNETFDEIMSPPASPVTQEGNRSIEQTFKEIIEPEPRQGSMVHDIKEGGRQADISETAARGFIDKPDSYARYLAKEWYPDQPIKQSIQNFGTYNGKVYHIDPQTGEQTWAMDPGASNWRNWVKRGIQAVPEVGQAATGIATAPLHMAGPGGSALAVGGTMATGAGLEAGRQAIGGMLSGESQTNPFKIGMEGAMGLVPEVPGATGVRAGVGRAARDIEKYAAEEAAQREARAEGYLSKEGFDTAEKAALSPGESTQLASVISTERYMAQHPDTADQFINWREERDTAATSAVNTYIEGLRQGVGNETAAANARQVAGDTIEAAKKVRRDKARPLYRQAFEQSGPMDVADIAAELQRRAEKAKGTQFGAVFKRHLDSLYTTVKDPETGEARQVLKDDLEDLDWVLKSMHAETDPSSKTYAGKIVAGQIKDMEFALKNTLHEQAPLYKEARQVFAEDSPGVDRLLGGGVEAIFKIKDADLAKAAHRIFSGGSFSTEEAQRVMMVLRAKDPKTADSFLGNYLHGEVMAAMKETQTGQVLAPTGKIRQRLFGDQTKRARLRALMTNNQYDALSDMMEFLADTTRGPAHVGSPTHSYGLIEQGIKEHAGTLPGRTARRLMKGLSFDIVPKIAEWWETKAFDATLENLVDVTVKKGARKELASLRKYKAGDARRMVGLFFLLAGGAEAGLEQLGLNPRQMFESKQTNPSLEPAQ